VEKERQLELWIQRVVDIWRNPPCCEVERKEFKSKNGLPALDSYQLEPDKDFWDKFPKNFSESREALIDSVKLERLARQCGLGDHVLLAVVTQDLSAGADIGCGGESRLPTCSSNSASAIAAGEQVTDAVASWVKKGFVRGPLEPHCIPMDAKINGLMCRPKPDSGVRVIMNMSAP
jgi:hypothetical protein